MDWMFFVKNRFWWIKHEATSVLRTLPHWKRAREIYAAFCYKCLQSLFTLYVVYKQMRYYGPQQSQVFPIYSCAVTVEEKQEMYQRIETLECTIDSLGSLSTPEELLGELESRMTNLQQEIQRRIEGLEVTLSRPGLSTECLAELATQIADLQQGTHQRLEVLEDSLSRPSTSEEHFAELTSQIADLKQETGRRLEMLEGSLSRPDISEVRFAELESRITNLQQETGQRIEAFEGTLQGLNTSGERLAELEGRVTRLQQAFQAPGLSRPVAAAPEERKATLLTARGFAARHGVDWNQMQAWIDTQVLTPALSSEGLPDYLLTPDQQSMLIRYWKSRKIPYTPCEQCPHYVLFGPQNRLA